MGWLDFLPEISLPEHVDIDVINIGDDVDGDLVEGDQVDTEYAVKSEGDIVPISEIERVISGELSGDAPLELRQDKHELVIDPVNLEGEDEWEETVKPGLKAGWEEQRTVSTRSAYPVLLQAERNITDETVSEILQFFEGKVFTSDYLLLQSSLVIDRAMNTADGAKMNDWELKRRKRNLAEKYHDGAFSLPSMCTSGYFDPDELFREVYDIVQEDSAYDTNNFDSIFRKMVLNKPFVAYAKDSQSPEELTDIVRGKISRLPNYGIPIPYIDVRGIGGSNHEKIRTTMEAIEKEYDLAYDERVGENELIVRIDTASLL